MKLNHKKEEEIVFCRDLFKTGRQAGIRDHGPGMARLSPAHLQCTWGVWVTRARWKAASGSWRADWLVMHPAVHPPLTPPDAPFNVQKKTLLENAPQNIRDVTNCSKNQNTKMDLFFHQKKFSSLGNILRLFFHSM